MLENLPQAVGRAMQDIRPGVEKTVFYDEAFDQVPESLTLTSEAFADGETIPPRFTADGEKLSPPLAWTGTPDEAVAMVLIVEDADAPAPTPLVHALAWALPGGDGALKEGAMRSATSGGEAVSLGLNSFFTAQYLPPDPPPGHGVHHYVFQIFALNAPAELHGKPIRGQVVHAIKDRVIAKGRLIGAFERA